MDNLEINRNRLSTPYDLHMTLKHILELSGHKNNFQPLPGCSGCQSLFKLLPFNRSCESAGIDNHWCACKSYKPVDSKDPIIAQQVKLVIDWMNQELSKARTSKTKKLLCSTRNVTKIISAQKSDVINHNTTNEYSDYLIMFAASPSDAIFESTIRHHRFRDNNFVIENVSRLDEQSWQSFCVHSDDLKKLCFCKKNLSKRKLK